MKHTLVSIILIALAAPCSAQWKTVGANGQVLAFGAHDTNFFMSVHGVLWRYIPGEPPGSNFAEADNGINFSQGDVTSFASLGKYFFAGSALNGEPGAGYRSSDNGSNWVLNCAASVCSNGTYTFSVSDGIYQSKDSGNNNTWVKVTTFPASSLAAVGAYVFATTANGVWRSADSGDINTWSQLSPPITGPITVMGTLLFIPGNGMLAESTDNGSNWSTISADSGSMPLMVNVLVTDGKNLFAGTTKGVYLSMDTGRTWRVENQGLTYLDIDALGVFDTLLFMNSNPYYTAMRPISEMTDTTPADVVQLPQIGDTIRIYPNPATGTVTILTVGTSISGVNVRNVLGEDVLDMAASYSSEMTLDLSQFPAGTYFLIIQTRSGNILRKIVKE